MSFKLGDIVIDRIQYGIAEDFDGKILYALTQLADATIDITAESKEAKDKDGTLIKKFWTSKAGTFTANNAMINTNILSATSGSDPIFASVENPVNMPRIVKVQAGKTVSIKNYVEGTVTVNALYANGTMGEAYSLSASNASETEFKLDESGILTPPTPAEGSDVTQFIVKYQRKVTDGVAIENRADKFPGTVRLTLKALCIDPCYADTLRSCYIVIPSFQVSPEVSLSLQTDSQLEYKGDLQVAYCNNKKTLYEFYMASDDEEDEE